MWYKYAILMCILFFNVNNALLHANPSEVWSQANKDYGNKDYKKAIKLYLSIPNYESNSQVLYNLGNAYYHQGKIGLSIASYKKALKIQPNENHIKKNLELAESGIQNPISDQSFILLKLWHNLILLFSPFIWSVISILSALFLAFFYYRYKRQKNQKRILIYLSSVMAIISILGMIGSYNYWQSINKAVVISATNQYFNDFSMKNAVERTIPEGTTVDILEKKEAVVKVLLPNGIEAYISQSILEEI